MKRTCRQNGLPCSKKDAVYLTERILCLDEFKVRKQLADKSLTQPDADLQATATLKSVLPEVQADSLPQKERIVTLERALQTLM